MTIGQTILEGETVPLGLATLECQLCEWFEKGYQAALCELPIDADATEDEITSVRAYGVEILLHRRLYHISDGDYPN